MLPFPSVVKAHQFFTEESWDSFKQIFETYMIEASKVLFGSSELFSNLVSQELSKSILQDIVNAC